MKKFTTLISFILLCATALFAQAPEKFTYQAVVRNSSNALVTNTQVGVRVNVLQGSASGNVVYSETHVATTNANGLITVSIGGGSVLHGSFAGIDWSDGPYFLKTDIDPNGGNDYSITSVQQLLSVPYALYAKEAANSFSGDYNDLTNAPAIPTVPANVSAFANDAGYITGYTESDPQYNAWDKDYNDLINKPTIPTVPTNVSAFTNDVGYITGYSETDPQYNAWDKDYNDLINKPTIPTVPTNVSAFTNDAGYITLPQIPAQVNADWNATTGAAQILNKPTLFSGNYNDLTNKPSLFSGNYNDLTNKPTLFDGNYNSLTNRPNLAAVALSGNYNDLINKPAIPTAVGELTNNVGYITQAQVPAQVNADWNATSGAAQILNKPTLFSGNYNDLTNKPVIPTVPTNVSAFTNDAGYITSADIPTVPTNVSAFTNDAGYLTTYAETDPQFNAWDKDYNDLINTPTIPTVPTDVSAFNNDMGYMTSYTETDPEFTAWDKDYNDLINTPTIPTVPNNVSAFNNDAGYLTGYTETQTLEQVTANGNSAGNRQLKNVSDPTENLDAVNLRTLTSQINSLQDNFQQQMQQMQQQMQQMQQQIDSLQDIVNSLDTNHNTAGGAVIDAKSCPTAPTATDHEGNVYATVQIGNQCWMRDNLRTTTSPSTGTYLIPAAGTGYTYTGKQAFWYNNDSATYAPMNYGLLYNWNAAADTFNATYGETSVNTSYSNAVSVAFTGYRRGICPEGWHLPSDAEWTTMTDYVSSQSEYVCGGNTSYIAKALADSVGWNSYTNTCAVGNNQSENNATGFSAVPAGYCLGSSFGDAGGSAGFWSSSQYESSPYYAWSRYLYYRTARVYRDGNYYKYYGYSVRCLRDETGGGGSTATLPTVTTNTVSNITPTTATSGGNIIADGGASVTARGVCWSTSQNPTVSNSHTTDGSGTGSFSSSISGLTANTTYYVRAYATNSVGTAYGNEVSFTTLSTAVIDSKSCPTAPTVTDHEGNVYATVQIGNQCWMRDNLRTTTSPSTGTYLIPASSTGYTYTGKQAFWYNNDSATYAPQNYGLLYNWNAAVDTFNTAYGETSVNSSNAVSVTFTGHRRGICPAGWHLPSDAEWTQLTDYVSSQSEFQCGGNSNCIAKALASTEGWNTYTNNCVVGNDPSTNNATGFSAVPAGYCLGSSFYGAGDYAFFWSSAQNASYDAYDHYLSYYVAFVSRYNDDKYLGRSVRCLRDDVSGGGGSGSSAVIDSKSCPGTPTVTDHEGNVYATVQIGNQCWMRDNLRTTTSPSTGTYLIPAANANYTYTGKQAFWYNNDSATYAPMNYGLLYNWNAAVDTFNTSYGETSTSSGNAVSVTFSGHRRGICPVGWHLPSDAEWNTMEATVSGSDWQTSYETSTGYRGNHAGKLAGGDNWLSSTTSGAPGDYGNADRNVSGFSAVPAGSCLGSSFSGAGDYASFWSSTQDGSYYAYSRGLYYYNALVGRYGDAKLNGFSVRCLRDSGGGDGSSATLPTVTTNTVSNITPTTATSGGNVTSDGGASVTARGVCWSTSQNPMASDSHTTDGSGTGSFSSSITGLTANTTYYVRAYATNSAGTAYGAEVSFTTSSAAVIDAKSCPTAPTVTDHEGNVYATVQIGSQCWMRDNLRTTTSPSTGTYLIPAAGTGYTFTGKQARWYNNDSATYAPMNYGLLYNWNAAVDTFNTAYEETSVNTDYSNAMSVTFNGHRRGICPVGWHLPSDAEWNTMEATVSGSDWQTSYETSTGYRGNHAGKLAGGDNWLSSTTSGAPGDYGNADRNVSGFSAVPAGYCGGSSFNGAGYYAYFWSSTQGGSHYAWYRSLRYDSADVRRNSDLKYRGFSVRCLRD